MSQENIAFVRGLYEAFARGDVPTVLAGFDENIEWNEAEGMPYGGQYHGPEAVAENVFGPITNEENKNIPEIAWNEIAAVVPLVIFMVWIGVHPNTFLKKMEPSVKHLLTAVHSPSGGPQTSTSTSVPSGARRISSGIPSSSTTRRSGFASRRTSCAAWAARGRGSARWPRASSAASCSTASTT